MRRHLRPRAEQPACQCVCVLAPRPGKRAQEPPAQARRHLVQRLATGRTGSDTTGSQRPRRLRHQDRPVDRPSGRPAPCGGGSSCRHGPALSFAAHTPPVSLRGTAAYPSGTRRSVTRCLQAPSGGAQLTDGNGRLGCPAPSGRHRAGGCQRGLRALSDGRVYATAPGPVQGRRATVKGKARQARRPSFGRALLLRQRPGPFHTRRARSGGRRRKPR